MALGSAASPPLLLEARADVSVSDKEGHTALYHAVLTGTADSIRVLAAAGASRTRAAPAALNALGATSEVLEEHTIDWGLGLLVRGLCKLLWREATPGL